MIVNINGNPCYLTKYGRKRKNWKGMLRQEAKQKLKDIKICFECHKTEEEAGKLTVHHIIPLTKITEENRELIQSRYNVIKLCPDCHREIHEAKK